MDQSQKIRNLELKLHAIVFLFVIAIIGSAFVFLPSLKNVARALTGTYDKATGASLDVSDWNNLDNDFLDKSGDVMSGDLDMGSHRVTNVSPPTVGTDAANQAYVLSQVGGLSPIEDESGNELKMICGKTTPGSTNWQVHNSDTVYVDIDMPASAGFTTTPYYFVSLGGNGYQQRVQGASSLFYASNVGFTVYVRYMSGTWSPAEATTWNWHMNWCAVGL